MDKHLTFMRRAMELAEQARGKSSPNPFVGALIVNNDQIAGEGFTQVYGSDHAEIQAIKTAKKKCESADMYVTLEPCSHHGKTPPCVNAIIDSGIRSVFIGIQDPNPLVNGKGIEMLTAAGIQVEVGFLENEITRQLEYYLTYITKNRPFVILKAAISLGGRIAAEDGSSRWISCEESRLKTHELRQEVDAIITGIGTILKDDPLLNVRLPQPHKQPVRVILDTKCSFPLDCFVALTSGKQKTLVFSDSEFVTLKKEDKIKELGIELVKIRSDGKHLNLNMVMTELFNRKISVVLVEAGTQINSSFLNAHLVDKMIVFIAPKLLGGDFMAWQNIGVGNIEKAWNLNDLDIRISGTDVMVTGYPGYQ